MRTPADLRTAIAAALRAADIGLLRVEEALDGQLDEDGLKASGAGRKAAHVAWIGTENVRPLTQYVYAMEAVFAVMCVDDGKARSATTIEFAAKVAALVFNNDWGFAEAELPTEIRILPYQNEGLRVANVSMTIVTFRQAIQIETPVSLRKPVTERSDTAPPFEGVEDIDLGPLEPA